MRCRDAERKLDDLREGRLAAAEASAVRAHVASCDSCARQARIEAAIARDLARLRSPLPEAIRIEDRVMARIALLPTPKRADRAPGPIVIGAAAASILLALALAALAWQAPSAGLLWIGLKNLGSACAAALAALPDVLVAAARLLRPLVEAARNTLVAIDTLWRVVEPAARLLVLGCLAMTSAIALYVLGRDLRPVAVVKER